jgi:hypothetical protein
MTRRELGAAFAAAGELFAIEFGLSQVYGAGTGVRCELIDSKAGIYNVIKVANTGSVSALDISVDSTKSKLLWDKDTGRAADKPRNVFADENYLADPPYLPIQSLLPGSDVVLVCLREWGAPQQDILQVAWKTPDGQVHRSEQSWSWTLRR